jgi:hypothetical protein
MVQPVECNPEIVTLPWVMMEPLPDLPLPDPSLALIPLAAPSGGSPAGPTSWSSFVDHAGARKSNTDGPHSEHGRCRKSKASRLADRNCPGYHDVCPHRT